MRDGNKIYFPERNIFLMDNHKWAFYIWELALSKSLIKQNATLFHIDAHLDDLPFVLEDNPEYLELKTIEEIYDFTEKHITYDTFIWPAFGRGTINNIVYVSDFFQEAFEDWSRNYVEGRIYDGLRLHNINELKKAVENKKLERFTSNNSLILNIDLDFFNEENYYDNKPKLKSDKEVKETLTYLKNLYDWNLITVALSPECCGGEEACEHLFQIFLDVFELNYSKGLPWSK